LIDSKKVLQLLTDAGQPLTRREMSHRLGLDKQGSDDKLRPVLQELVSRGRVVRNRKAAYGLPDHMDLIPGRIQAHANGFGFVIPDSGDSDLFLSPREMRQVFHGDRVLAAVTGLDRRGRREGTIVEVVAREHERVVGRFVKESGLGLLVPDDPRLIQDILIPPDFQGEARPGEIIVAAIEQYPSPVRGPVGRVIAVLGQGDEPGMATEIAIHNHQLPHAFPDEVDSEAEAFGDRIDPESVKGREDLRDLPLITIDGADARDFDDAVLARREGSGYSLIVAIADVAEYVQPGSALDTEALRRSTSVYFPDRVIPMLPETLSNGLCSLNPDVDRLCLACHLRLDKQGKVTSSRFYEAVLRSHARLTYDQVRKITEDGDEELRKKHEPVLGNIECLGEVYRLLRKRREARGALDFDSSEIYFSFDEEGRVADIRPRTRHDAHKLIEEAMVAANVEASKFVAESKLPMLFRVHETPPSTKLDGLEAFLRAQGLQVAWDEDPTPQQFARIQQQVRGRPDEPLVNAVLLRSMALAVYQAENKGHFGLALESYAHFTSPIRRYPDLLLHRAIKHIARRQKKSGFPYSHRRMDELGEHCSWLDRRAEEAARDVDQRLKCHFMQRHIGDEFDGVVTGVTSFGLFVEVGNLGVDGLVHVTSLPNDYYHFDPVSHVLTGERQGMRFRLADRVRIRVAAVNLDDRKIDFALVEALDSQAPDGAGESGPAAGRGRQADRKPANKKKKRSGSKKKGGGKGGNAKKAARKGR